MDQEPPGDVSIESAAFSKPPSKAQQAKREAEKLAELRRSLANARPVVSEPNSSSSIALPREDSQNNARPANQGEVLDLVQQPGGSSAYPGSENARPTNELERRATKVYGSYFGPNWRDVLSRELLVNVRAATTQDLANNPAVRGFVATQAEVLSDSKKLVRNHIILFSNGTEFGLRSEIGESIYNILEDVVVTGSLPGTESNLPSGIRSLVQGGTTPEAVVDFCRQLLDRWDSAYTTRPVRYAGMNPNTRRNYKGIPEWKSEGFADGIAVEIRRRSGKPLDAHEQQIRGGFNHYQQEIIKASADIFLPPVVVQK